MRACVTQECGSDEAARALLLMAMVEARTQPHEQLDCLRRAARCLRTSAASDAALVAPLLALAPSQPPPCFVLGEERCVLSCRSFLPL